MKDSDEDTDDEDKQKEDKRSKKIKEQFLDEAFKKAELLKKTHSEKKEKKKVEKKPIRKLGFVVIIIAILGLAVINYMPWMYIKYDSDYGTIEEYYTYSDFDDEVKYNEIYNLFESTCSNCSHNSRNYFGLTMNDFSGTQRLMSYSLIVLGLLGFIFTIFIIIDRIKNFSEETFTIIHSIFISSIILIFLITFLSTIKFLGAHLLFEINKPFLEVLDITNVDMFFFIPYIFFFFSLCLLIIGLMLIKANFNKALNSLETDKFEESYSIYRYENRL